LSDGGYTCPIINVQEAHEILRNAPETRGSSCELQMRLPYTKFLLVWAPTKGITSIIDCEQLPEYDDSIGKDRTILRLFLFRHYSEQKVLLSLGTVFVRDNLKYGLQENFDCKYIPKRLSEVQISRESQTEIASIMLDIFLFSTKLMQCKNISYEEYDPNKGIQWRKQKNKKKKPRPPFVKYKTLHIEPFKQRQQVAGSPTTEPDNLQRLHTVRGHFKTYTKERKLFGKYVGTYWWGDCIKGNPEYGLIDKDYELRIPASAFKMITKTKPDVGTHQG